MSTQIREFLDARGTRWLGTAVAPLGWVISALFVGEGILLKAGAPDWITGMVGVLIGVAVVFYLVVYGVFAVKNPDLLRSERYNIEKMALERYKGDSVAGLVEMDPSKRVEPGKEPPKLGSGETQ